MRAHLILAVTASVALSGCASILNKSTQPINVSASNGQTVSGTVNGVAFQAPGVVEVRRENKDQVFTATTEGCTGETIAGKKVDSAFFINILSGGVLGSSTDFATQKMWKYDDSVVIACKG